MNNLGNLIGKHFLGMVNLGTLQSSQTAHLIHRQERQKSQAFLHFHILHVSPVLIKLVGRGLLWVKPHSSLHSLAHLNALAGGQELKGQTISRLVLFSSNQLHAADDIGPLIIAA